MEPNSSSRPAPLGRLARVWARHPVYFVTSCTRERRPILAADSIHTLLRAEWHAAEARHGWLTGRYVIMPDHVHFFCCATPGAKPLSGFLQRWKEWTAKSLVGAGLVAAPLWQHRFFDHVLRSEESYAEKWLYVRENPVRARLVDRAEDWRYAGHIHFDEP